jgi:hypothetical protein
MTSMSANAGLLPERVENAAQERIVANSVSAAHLMVRLPSAECPESARLAHCLGGPLT